MNHHSTLSLSLAAQKSGGTSVAGLSAHDFEDYEGGVLFLLKRGLNPPYMGIRVNVIERFDIPPFLLTKEGYIWLREPPTLDGVPLFPGVLVRLKLKPPVSVHLINGHVMTLYVDNGQLVAVHFQRVNETNLGCTICGNVSIEGYCGGCTRMAYCGDECADEHWIEGGHGRECSK